MTGLVLAGVVVVLLLLVCVVATVWLDTAPAARAQRELDDAHDAVDAVLTRARSEMEDVAYWDRRTRQRMSDSFGNWREW